MNNLNLPVKSLSALLLFAATGLSALCVHAEEIVPAKTQSDEQISVWVDNAPLGLFVSQLAMITGRKADIAGELEGQVSGRFNGSMAETLSEVGLQHPILFELDDTTLSAVAASERRSATIALGDSNAEVKMRIQLLSDLLPGNEVEMRNGEVVVSGHPDFVKRIGKTVASLAGEQDQQLAGFSVMQDAESFEDSKSVLSTEPESSIPVVDVAAQMMVGDDVDVASDVDVAEPVTTAKPILWVTDIPGYETF